MIVNRSLIVQSSGSGCIRADVVALDECISYPTIDIVADYNSITPSDDDITCRWSRPADAMAVTLIDCNSRLTVSSVGAGKRRGSVARRVCPDEATLDYIVVVRKK